MRRDTQLLFDTVVNGGYCIGCGNCAALNGSPITMQFDQFGRYRAFADPDSITEAPDESYLEVCPFSDRAVDEDVIGEELYGREASRSPTIGYYLDSFVGHVIEDSFRSMGSSGGFGTWVVCELLRRGLVDGVLHIRPSDTKSNRSPLFEYQMSTSLEEIAAGAKSRYYPVEMSSVLSRLRGCTGRYAVVGLPCFIKAVRLICRHDSELSSRVAFTVALFCGHLKSTAWAEMLAWQCGVTPDCISSIDFRKKLPNRAASDYGVEVQCTNQKGQPASYTCAVSELYGTDWGLGFFKYKACDYCDDITGETADIAVGDAWLPDFVDDSRGTNIVVVRNLVVSKLLRTAQQEGRVKLTPITPNQVVQAQSSNYRHRRTGLALRLHDNIKKGRWQPPKRIQPRAFWNRPLFRRRIRLRQRLAELSHQAFAAAKSAKEFEVFVRQMQPEVVKYRRTYPPKLLLSGVRLIRRVIAWARR